MRPLFLIIFCMISLTLYAGPGGGGGGSVREVSYFEQQKGSSDEGMNKSIRSDNRFASEISKFLSLVELETELPISNIQTIHGEIITKENIPDHYPLSKIHYIEMIDGQILSTEDILELIQSDHQNLTSL